MNTNRMPAFTAEASLYTTGSPYKVDTPPGTRDGDVSRVVPALRVACGMKECCIIWEGGHYCWFKE